MKKAITILLLVVLTVISVFPMNVFAAADSELEKALNIVKERITIPDEYQEFSYSMSTEASRKVWYMNWRNKEDRNAANINVRIDDKGTIEAYNFYKYETYQDTRKLPKYSRDNAEAAAKAFLEKVNPGYKFIPVNNSYYDSDSIYGSTYRFSFARSINGVPFYSNSCSVEVNRNTNEVMQFYLNWSYDLEYPDASKAITLQQAQKNYVEKIGLKLAYNYYIDENENTKIFAAYSPMYNNNYSIDAISGEKTITSQRYYANTAAEKSALMDASMGGAGGKAVVLTPEELKAVENNSKLLSQEEAEALARNFKPLELTADFTVRYSRLEKAYYQKGEYQWSLDFTNEAQAAQSKTDNYRYASITLNAATGEIKSFYTYFPTSSNEPVYNKEASKAIVENFLKELLPAKFNASKYDENSADYRIYQDENQSRYSFRYMRQVNGIEFSGNYINVEFDAINGKISSLSVNWFEADFPAIDKVISLAEANEILLDEIGLELNYTLQYENEIYLKYEAADYKPAVKLVYSLKNTKPALIDANKGIIINSDAKPFKENKQIEYTDIKGHFAEKQINILGQFGISLEGTEFKPDSIITQKDYLYLLMKGISGYYSLYPESEKEIAAMYSELIKQGVVKENEKAPASAVSRQDAVKFMIRALKYDKIADVKDIFKCDFIDADQIDSSLIGYVAIASGLKIIQGSDGYFSPAANLTRAEAMVMIYNYLSN